MLAVALAVGLAVATSLSWNETSGGAGDHKVASVLDGDTIALTDGRRVRLAQIDAPELGEAECYAQEAQALLASMLPVGSRVTLERDPALDDVDRFGRLIRYVVKDELIVNLELVRRGAASVWFLNGARGRHAAELLAAVRRARRVLSGVWRVCLTTRLDTSRGVQTGRALGALHAPSDRPSGR